MPTNVAWTANRLKLSFEEWNYNSTVPQAAAFLSWTKHHLMDGHPVVFFPICKGDGHECYRDNEHPNGACPNNGTTDHVEVMFGIFSNHDDNDTNVYADDVVVHTSDQDLEPYYRPLRSLPDTLEMEGNCRDAVAGFGHNEMYPCIDQSVTYGLAVKGLATEDNLPRVALQVDIQQEPNVRMMQRPIDVHGTITVSGLRMNGSEYVLYRYDNTDDVPLRAPYNTTAAVMVTTFRATNETFTYKDPSPFSSHSATYYVAVPSSSL